MNVHKNARSTPRSRARLIELVEQQGWSISAAARASGLSERRARHWMHRARANEPLTDRSSRPLRSKSLPERIRNLVVTLRREGRTLMQIAELSGVSCSSVARICRAHGLNRLQLIGAPAAVPIRRYEWSRPGELLHIDTKKLGRFHKIGHRITHNKTYGKGGGWEFVHVAIDDHSRLTYAEILDDELATTTVGFFRRAVDWFACRGVNVQRVMTDNGSAYISNRFALACGSAGVKHIRIRPRTPQTNGKAERVIQSLLREWAYRFAYSNSDERQQWLAPYLHFYNIHRRHSALGYNPPISRLARNNVLTFDT